jgi:hypothetical protein
MRRARARMSLCLYAPMAADRVGLRQLTSAVGFPHWFRGEELAVAGGGGDGRVRTGKGRDGHNKLEGKFFFFCLFIFRVFYTEYNLEIFRVTLATVMHFPILQTLTLLLDTVPNNPWYPR